MNWIKFYLKVILCFFLFQVYIAPTLSERIGPNHYSLSFYTFLLAAGISIAIVFGIPALCSYIGAQIKKQQQQRDGERYALDQHNADEFAHQTKLRRIREEMQVRNEEEIRHLIAVIEVQHKADTLKMQELTRLKQQFAEQQQGDLASVLAQLQRMRDGTT